MKYLLLVAIATVFLGGMGSVSAAQMGNQTKAARSAVIKSSAATVRGTNFQNYWNVSY
jgi:hypothetical protein